MREYLLNKKYTLEEHLKSISIEDKDYEILYSIWDLNKKNLTQGLNLVSASFPHYSIHDVNHSMTIIDNIQCFLGEDRIRRLSATDTFLILMAGLTHDIGMILMSNIVESEWQRDDFKSLLEVFSNSSDSVIAKSAKLLMRIQNHEADNDLKDFSWALQVKNAVIVLTAEIFRAKHANQSAIYLRSNETFKQLANNFHAEQLPSRFMDLLANIAFLHGEDFKTVMSKLYQEANGYKGDYIHPRFIAYMIRLGDLLDFDNNRFNIYSQKILNEIPETSKLHEQKHASVKHMLVSPNSIEAELDCTDEEVYRVSRSWFDWLEKEVNNQSREWTNISPNDLGGLPPVISKDSIKILFNGIQSNPELLNLRFSMSQKKIFEILQGGGIYKYPGFVFIREIVQNAFDASKIQMWKDIKLGFYDSYYSPKNILDNISYPSDMKYEIYKQYPVELEVKWKDEHKNILHFECKDRGTGISESTLLRMTNFVGASQKKDPNYTDFYEGMPYWLRPTAAFGIGLQSIFFVNSKFEVETSYPGETTKRIIFRSPANNQYSSIIQENFEKKRGTTVKIDIPKERFRELFGGSFSLNILDSVDVFEEGKESLYLAKIDDFVQNTFGQEKYFFFIYNTENQYQCITKYQKEENISNKKIDLNSNYRYSYSYQGDLLFFEFDEKKIGSTFRIFFKNTWGTEHFIHRIYLRDVLVANAQISNPKIRYMGFEWNLNNQETDKVVDLSRDNLTYNGKQWITNTLLKDLLPEILSEIDKIFIKELKNKNSTLEIQYANFCLTAFAFHISVDLGSLDSIFIPKDIVSKGNNKISIKQLLESKSLYLISNFKTIGNNIAPDIRKEIETKYDKLSDKIVLWGDSYLYDSLIFNYKCTNIFKYESDYQIYKIEKIQESQSIPTPVSCNDIDSYLSGELERFCSFGCSRKTIYGLSQYTQIIVHKKWISGFEVFPKYSTCCIYSPFSKIGQEKDLLEKVNGMNDLEIKNYINEHLSEYVSEYLIKLTMDFNINNFVTEEQIKTGYSSLIYDFIMAKLKTNNGHIDK